MSLHVAFLEFVTNWGGAPRCSLELADRLSKHVQVSLIDPYGCNERFREVASQAGFDYHVLCPGEGVRIIGGLHNPISRAIRLAQSMPHMLKVRSRAVRKLKDIGASVVLSNNPKSLYMSVARSLDIARVAYLHGWYLPHQVPTHARRLYVRHCDRCIAVSYATRVAVSCSGVDPAKVDVVQNCIDVDAMLSLAERPLDSPLPQADRPVRILLPAGFMRTKGQHTAIQAMRDILDAGKDAVLYLAGYQAPGGDESYLPSIQALAERTGVADRVEFLGMRHDVPQLMQACNVVILPTHTEGMPRTILEAMALGRPVVATPVGGVLDLILPSVTGWLHEVEDPPSLARGVLDVIDHPEQTRAITDRAQTLMRDRFHIPGHTDRILRVLQGAVDDHAKRGSR